jgi:hypothetical protein
MRLEPNNTVEFKTSDFLFKVLSITGWLWGGKIAGLLE